MKIKGMLSVVTFERILVCFLFGSNLALISIANSSKQDALQSQRAVLEVRGIAESCLDIIGVSLEFEAELEEMEENEQFGSGI